ncbi:kinase-like domain-containing protein [Lactifluus volemus]|nr:kinase-like domain-containing protein [Lactifluus volemus]
MREASSHPFLLGLLASFHNAHAFYLVSEYCRSTLFDERHYMLESDKNLASAELACAVDHLHGLGIIHRDIKLENVMMRNDGHIVLGDFGLAYRLRHPRSPVWRISLSALTDRKFPWLGEHEQPASYLQQMMSTLSAGLTFENQSFGALLNRLFCVDQDVRADFSIVRRAAFFANINWQNVTAMSSSPSHLPQGRGHRLRPMLVNEIPSQFEDFARLSVHEDLYPNFTWLNPSMIVEEVTPGLSSTDSSFGSSAAVPSTPSESSLNDLSPVCENLQVLNTRPLSALEVCINKESVLTSFRGSGLCFGQKVEAIPTAENDEALVRMSIRSLDVGEEPVFDLPSGWKDAFASPLPDVTPPSLPQPEGPRKTSVLPRLKSLWKRATSKIMPRQA